jgi:hypothetical protein
MASHSEGVLLERYENGCLKYKLVCDLALQEVCLALSYLRGRSGGRFVEDGDRGDSVTGDTACAKRRQRNRDENFYVPAQASRAARLGAECGQHRNCYHCGR